MDWMNKIGTITWSYLRKYYNPCQPVSLRLFSNVASHRNHSEHYFHAPWRITSISKQYYSFYFVIFIEDKLSNSLNIKNIMLYELSGVRLRQVRRFSTGNIAIADKLSVTISFMHHFSRRIIHVWVWNTFLHTIWCIFNKNVNMYYIKYYKIVNEKTSSECCIFNFLSINYIESFIFTGLLKMRTRICSEFWWKSWFFGQVLFCKKVKVLFRVLFLSEPV